MVQDFTTSFDQFETFALSEMAKQPEKHDALSPFIPKCWTNRESTNSMIKCEPLNSLYDTLTDDTIAGYLLSPRRSGRIANQTKINYKELKQNVSKNKHKLKKSKRKSTIKQLFKKDTDKTKLKSKIKSTSNGNVGELAISIPLIQIQTNFLHGSVTKASVKRFEDSSLTVKPENSECTLMQVSEEKYNPAEKKTIFGKTKNCQIKEVLYIDDAFNKNVQYEQTKNVIEASEKRQQFPIRTTVEATIANQFPTAANKFENSFSGIFKSFRNCKEDNFVNPLKKIEKLEHNLAAKTFEENKFALIKSPARNFSKFNGFFQNKHKKIKRNFNEAFEVREEPLQNFMKFSDETQKFVNLQSRNEISEDHEIMEISNETQHCWVEKSSKHAKNFNEVFKKTQKKVMKFSDETQKFINLEPRNEISDDHQIMEVSNESQHCLVEKSSKDAENFSKVFKKTQKKVMKFSEETQKFINLEPRNEISDDHQIMEISNETQHCLVKRSSRDAENFNEIFKKIQIPEKNIVKEASGETQKKVMKFSDETQKFINLEPRNEISEDHQIMEISNETQHCWVEKSSRHAKNFNEVFKKTQKKLMKFSDEKQKFINLEPRNEISEPHQIMEVSNESQHCLVEKSSKDAENFNEIFKKIQIPEKNIVKEASGETQKKVMKFSDETQKFINLEPRNEISEDHQIMEISNETQHCLVEKSSRDAENFNEIFKKIQIPEKNIVKEASGEKEKFLDLTIMEVSEKTRTANKIDRPRNKRSTIIEVSNNYSNDAKKMDSDNCMAKKQTCEAESVKIQTLSMSQLRSAKQTTTITEAIEKCNQLSDQLSFIQISDENVQKKKNFTKTRIIEDKKEHGLIISEIPEEFQNQTSRNDSRNHTTMFKETFSDTFENSYGGDDDVFTVENNPQQNNVIGEIENDQLESNNSCTVMEIVDENENDDEKEVNEKIITEDLKSLIDENEKSFVDDHLAEMENDYHNPIEKIESEVEIYAESNADSEIEIIEETFLDNAENKERFNKNTDEEQMIYIQDNQRVYQQEFIEVIHQYNYFPFQNYQYPRYEYPIEENKFDYTPNNISFLTQRCGEFQIPQMHLDYNNYYRMQVPVQDNMEKEKLIITEYYDTDEEEEKDKDKDKPKLDVNKNHSQNKSSKVQPRSNANLNKLPPTLTQPPPIQFSSEQHYPSLQNFNQQKTQLDLQSQYQIGKICENSEQKNNQWQIVSAKNSTQTSSEQRDGQFYENTCGILPPQYNTDEENQSESHQMVQRIQEVLIRNNQCQEFQTQFVQSQQQGLSQNNLPEEFQTQIVQRQQQGMSQNIFPQENQPLSRIADIIKNNCHIHDVKFGKIKTLNGRLYRTGSLLISFGDNYQVQIIGDLILNNINENIAFDAFFSPRNPF